jgi:glycosyltransferase involved in cell wall biosynthesis
MPLSKTISERKSVMTHAEPRVSIGLPLFNAEKYLAQTLDSILTQTFTDFELIVSDNASTDQTRAICQSYALQDRRIRYYRNQKNLGAAPNFNRVFQLSSGEYFKWAAYDDLMSQDFLSECVRVLDENPEIIMCFPRSNVIDEEGRFLGEHAYKSDTSLSKPHLRFRSLVLSPGTGWQVFGLVRSSAVKKTALHGSYPSSDMVLLAELALYGPFYEIPKPLFFPRYHSEQGTQAIPVERDRTLFYDTSSEGKIVLPKWQYLSGYLRAIRHAPLNGYGRLYCYLQMLRWVMIPDHFRALGKDAIIAARQLTRLALSPRQENRQAAG